MNYAEQCRRENRKGVAHEKNNRRTGRRGWQKAYNADNVYQPKENKIENNVIT